MSTRTHGSNHVAKHFFTTGFLAASKHLHLKIDSRTHLTELDANKERNWSVIECDGLAESWEKRFVEIAPVAAEAYAREHGDELLCRTADARRASAKCLQQLDSTQPFYQQIRDIEAKDGGEVLQEAERLAAWPGVMQLHNADELYKLACCAVLNGDQGAKYIGQNPLENDQLMWQIQLVADGILSWKKIMTM